MGYECSLHLIDVKIKAGSVPMVSRALKTPTGRGTVRIRSFLERAVIDSEGFLAFKTSKDESDPYVPDADDGSVPALYGKWYEAEHIARWLKRHSEKTGRDANTSILLCRVVNRGAGRPNRVSGDFVDYLFQRCRGRIQAVNIIPR